MREFLFDINVNFFFSLRVAVEGLVDGVFEVELFFSFEEVEDGLVITYSISVGSVFVWTQGTQTANTEGQTNTYRYIVSDRHRQTYRESDRHTYKQQ